MVSVTFSPSGRNALSDLASEAQNALVDELAIVESDPRDRLRSDYGFTEYYFMFETSEKTYLAVASWSRSEEKVEITNIGPADSFYLGD